MSTFIWACYQVEPWWGPELQAPGAQRVYMQSTDDVWWWVDYTGDTPTPQDIWDSQHMLKTPDTN